MPALKNHTDYWLNPSAAAALDALEDTHGIVRINSAGRTEAEQNSLIRRWDAGGAHNRPPYLYEPARPAATSNHVKNGGCAIDTPDIAKMQRVGPAYGWHQPYPNSDPVHFEHTPVRIANPFGITTTIGLQKIARLYGYTGALDDIWGAGSAHGFARFLRNNWGYVGNDTLGPIMWAAIARWLRTRWGYVGNDVPGPVMRAALARAEAANRREL